MLCETKMVSILLQNILRIIFCSEKVIEMSSQLVKAKEVLDRKEKNQNLLIFSPTSEKFTLRLWREGGIVKIDIPKRF